jgi:hypothetical protein
LKHHIDHRRHRKLNLGVRPRESSVFLPSHLFAFSAFLCG